MKSPVLVTGASGLLGRALVEAFSGNGNPVLAQYHTQKPLDHPLCNWMWADFSSLEGVRKFLHSYREELCRCRILINNYGPITYKPVDKLTGEDFLHDFHHNVLTAFEITSFLLAEAGLDTVVNIGFKHAGEIRAYKNVLTYAAAKNALLLLTRSLEKQHPDVVFHYLSPPTLTGADVKGGDGVEKPPSTLAGEILQMI